MNESDIYRERSPPEAWREAVACCWEQRVHADRVQRVLPDGHADVLLYGSGQVELVGVYDRVALPVLQAGTVIRGIRLRPEAIASVFRLEASELRNLTGPAEDVIGARGTRRLRDDHAVDAWVRSIEPDRRTAAAVELLQFDSVERVARQLGISPLDPSDDSATLSTPDSASVWRPLNRVAPLRGSQLRGHTA